MQRIRENKVTCHAYVATRQYAKPGRCVKKNGLVPIRVESDVVPLCKVHRRMVEEGRQVSIKIPVQA